ncbi:MAG: xanthine dehydrogenase family protein subunit M [Acidobacteriota bacterium]
MIPTSFEYYAPKSVQEALDLLDKHQEEAKVLAGGHSLIPQMKLRLAAPRYIVDIGRIRGLDSIREENGAIVIGALATHHALESSALLQQKCPLLSETAAAIGDVQVRNRGTIGGSLAHADPAADWPAAMLAHDAEFKLVGKAGERRIPAEDFFLEMLATTLQANELLTEIRVPRLPARTGGCYLKMAQQASGFALVGVAACLTVDANQVCQQAGIGVTGIAPKAYRARAVEAALKGRKVDSDLIQKASQKAVEGVEALSDLHASEEFRLHLAKVYTRRALETAFARIK